MLERGGVLDLISVSCYCPAGLFRLPCRRTVNSYEAIVGSIKTDKTPIGLSKLLQAVARKVIGETVVEASETPTLPDSSHIKEDAYRYRTVLKAFKKANEDADDNQQLVLLSFLLSVTDYTNDQLNKLISFLYKRRRNANCSQLPPMAKSSFAHCSTWARWNS
jgi:hypothetical protein